MFPSAHSSCFRATAAPTACRFLLFVAAATSFGTGCATSRGDRWLGHFDGSVWNGALQEQWRRADRAVPEGLLLAAVPLSFFADDDFQEDRPRHDLTSSVKSSANAIPLVLGIGALGVGASRWSSGDDGRSFEIAAEALAATSFLTELTKKVVGRKRPDSDSRSSFPSGHSSFAFAAATLLIRDLDEIVDPDYRPLEYLLYLPAAAVAVERVEANRHWTSDVAVGALLGVLTANLIHDAHERRAGDDRPTIFAPRSRASWSFCSGDVEGRLAFGIQVDF